MSQHSPAADLYVVATPIGNLADMSYRAVEILSRVDLVAAEDTRHTRVLFEHYGITTPLTPLHEHNENAVAPQLLQRLLEGKSLALVTDAGTPLLSDPGYRLLNMAISANITVRAVPGASAVTAALSVAGLATDRFAFEGFLPSKQPARLACLHSLRGEQRTLVFFESSHRVVASIGDMALVFGEQRAAAVCRELTKRFETVLRAGLGSLHQTIVSDADQQKGEFVIVVAGAKPEQSAAMSKAVEMGHALQEFLSLSQASRVAARLCAVDRRELYRLLSRGQSKNSRDAS
jgi:16S rRNA (cytidine1402-2'-O)-methyltransferase